MPTRMKLDELLRAGGFSAAEIRQVHEGALVKVVAESTCDRELAVKFAFLVKAPPSSLKENFMTTTKTQEKDPSVLQSGLIETGTLEDFATLSLGPYGASMAKEYMAAAPGSTFNLSKKEIEGWQALKKKGGSDVTSVESHLRQLLFDRYLGYRESGLDGIFPYSRSGGKEYDSGLELRQKTELAEFMKREAPTFHKNLLEYPHAKPEGLDESYSWVNYKIDEKPTLVLIHRMGLQDGDVYVFCERHFYVSRSHNSLQGIGGTFPVEDGNTGMCYLQRTSTDQVSGFGSSTKRSIGARMMASKVADNFERARALFEEKSKHGN